MKQILYINAKREAYGIDQIRHTMTVRDLINYLELFDEEAEVYLKHDGGYTFGAITNNAPKSRKTQPGRRLPNFAG